MNCVIYKLSNIAKKSQYRPIGYYEDVVSKGKIIGDYVEIPHDEAVKLIDKYSSFNSEIKLKNDPKIWGPILWKKLHDRTAEYAIDIDSEKKWLDSFLSSIPCGECKKHFLKIIKKYPPDFSSKENYKKWAIDVHNSVNENLGKPIFIVE